MQFVVEIVHPLTLPVNSPGFTSTSSLFPISRNFTTPFASPK